MGAGWVQADIDSLKIAISSGLLSVTYNGPPARSQVYQNLSEMKALLADMVAEVAQAAGTRITFRRVGFRKGL